MTLNELRDALLEGRSWLPPARDENLPNYADYPSCPYADSDGYVPRYNQLRAAWWTIGWDDAMCGRRRYGFKKYLEGWNAANIVRIKKNARTGVFSDAGGKPFPWLCGKCGQTEVRPKKSTVQFNNIPVPDIDVPTCGNCGTQWFDCVTDEEVTRRAHKILASIYPPHSGRASSITRNNASKAELTMTLEEIQAAVRAGKTVHWKSDAYRVIFVTPGTSPSDWYVQQTRPDLSYRNRISLTWSDGVTINGNPEDFYIAKTREEVQEAKLAEAITEWADHYITVMGADDADVCLSVRRSAERVHKLFCEYRNLAAKGWA